MLLHYKFGKLNDFKEKCSFFSLKMKTKLVLTHEIQMETN